MDKCAFKAIQMTECAVVFLRLLYTSRLAMTATIAWASRLVAPHSGREHLTQVNSYFLLCSQISWIWELSAGRMMCRTLKIGREWQFRALGEMMLTSDKMGIATLCPTWLCSVCTLLASSHSPHGLELQQEFDYFLEYFNNKIGTNSKDLILKQGNCLFNETHPL